MLASTCLDHQQIYRNAQIIVTPSMCPMTPEKTSPLPHEFWQSRSCWILHLPPPPNAPKHASIHATSVPLSPGQEHSPPKGRSFSWGAGVSLSLSLSSSPWEYQSSGLSNGMMLLGQGLEELAHVNIRVERQAC